MLFPMTGLLYFPSNLQRLGRPRGPRPSSPCKTPMRPSRWAPSGAIFGLVLFHFGLRVNQIFIRCITDFWWFLVDVGRLQPKKKPQILVQFHGLTMLDFCRNFFRGMRFHPPQRWVKCQWSSQRFASVDRWIGGSVDWCRRNWWKLAGASSQT